MPSGGGDQATRTRLKKQLEEVCKTIEELSGAEADAWKGIAVSPAAVRKGGRSLLEIGDALQRQQQDRPVSRSRVKNGHCRRLGWAGMHLSDEAPALLSTIAVVSVVGLTLPYYICTTYRTWFIDEGFAIYRNPDARGETSILEVLRHDFWGTPLNPPDGYVTHKSFRPLITLLYALEWQTWEALGWGGGAQMHPMRALSCLIHSFNSWLTWCILRRLRIPLWWATIAAGLFAAHPIHIENIVYLVGRADALATTFSQLAVLLYFQLSLRDNSKLPLWSYVVLIVLTAAGGLCKEPAFTVLFFLACAELVLHTRWLHVLGLLLCFFALGATRTWYVGGTEAGFSYVDTPIRYQESWTTRTLSYLFQHAYYCRLLVLPWHQSWDYSYDALPMVTSLLDLRMLGISSAYLSIASLAAWGLRFRRENPVMILALGMIVIPFVPASNLLFLVGTTIGERLLYPCTVGWSLLLAALATVHIGKSSGWMRWLWRSSIRGLALLLLLLYVWKSNVRMSHWRNTRTLFEEDADHWSRSAKVMHSKASELQGRGDLEGALDGYLKSLAIFDDQAITDYCIARIYINMGRFQDAYDRFNKILTGHGIGFHDGNDFLWMTDLGYLLVQIGADGDGASYLQEGLERMPYSCYGWNALGVAQARMGKLEDALQALSQGLACDNTSASIWNNLALVYAYGNAMNEAQHALQQAAALNATHPVVVHNGAVLGGVSVVNAQPQFSLYIPPPGPR
mmetsp:Transcript_12602/g.28553  ORF Transcript_12602/g.28553 Transcript_12602/m.28553 type:complete len:738 (+) Transcript_12602:62-2275(+)